MYTPTLQIDTEETDKFCNILKTTYEKEKTNITLALGNWNSKIGEEDKNNYLTRPYCMESRTLEDKTY